VRDGPREARAAAFGEEPDREPGEISHCLVGLSSVSCREGRKSENATLVTTIPFTNPLTGALSLIVFCGGASD
jgi:hypothetical protein